MAYGVTIDGFRTKRLADIKTELEDALKDTFGAGINLDPRAPLGQIVGILAERESLIWELAEGVYNSQYPDTAEGVPLDNAVALTGVSRKQQTKSTVVAFLLGTAGTLIPAGSVASVVGNTTARFVTDQDETIEPAVDEVQKIQFSAVPDNGSFALTYDGDESALIQFDDIALDVQNALNGLPGLSAVTVTGDYTVGFTITFAGADGSKEQPLLSVTSNTLELTSNPVNATPSVLTEGKPARVEAAMTAETAGVVQAPANSLTVIETPVSGWNSIYNPLDAILGTDVETDAELRVRRAQTVEKAGAGTTEAIRADLIALDGVVAVLVFENRTMVTDVDGRPAKSFEVVIQGGDNTEIAQTIFDDKPAGIETYGNTTVNITDSQGFIVPINFSRPNAVQIWLELDLTVTDQYPLDGDAQVKAAILAYANTLGLGADVIVYPHLIASLNNIPGIVDVVTRIGTTNTPTLDDNIIIGLDEIADFDTSRITVTIL
jgi:uncharacterized phage protein gp47/JayE